MSTIYDNAVGSILDNYADAIEGGTAYRGAGTAYHGIAGTQSLDELASTTLTEDAGGSATLLTADDLGDVQGALLARGDTGPPFFVLGAGGTAANLGAARKIAAFTASAAGPPETPATYTVAALPAANNAGDTYTVLEGFKRSPDGADLRAGGDASEAWDRFFDLRARPGTRDGWYGNGVQQFTTVLDLRLRLRKAARQRNAAAAVFENLLRLRTVLARGDHRDGAYTQVLLISEDAPEIESETDTMLIAVDHYRLIYRVSSTFL
ncbi:MAG TPA: hypothetical protein VJ787_08990 [Thermoleophilia bacterium]|nr:hypothetical protein [Thermoleophilia bacterium]